MSLTPPPFPCCCRYDQLSKGELLALARFLGRHVGYIQALPLPSDSLFDAEKPDLPTGQPPPKRRRTSLAAEPSLQNGHQAPLPGASSHFHPSLIPGAQSALGASSHPGAESVSGSETGPGGDRLPSLEALGVPPRWRPFAAFLRAQRKGLRDRLTDFGLPDRLLTSAEEYVPVDPVELLEFDGRDPVWLHTDLLVDNILMAKRGGVESGETKGGAEGEKLSANGGSKVEEGKETRRDDAKKGGDEQRLKEAGRSGEMEESNGTVWREEGAAETGSGYEAVHILDFADARTGEPSNEMPFL